MVGMIATRGGDETVSEPTSELEVLRQDVRGRVRIPGGKREAILDAFEASGMSGAAFARQWGLKYPTFANWVQRRRRDREKGPESRTATKSISLVEALVGQDFSANAGLKIEAPGGIKLWVRRREEIALAVELVKALSSC